MFINQSVSNYIYLRLWDKLHYSDVILSAMVSQTTVISMVCSTVCLGTDQRKHQCSVSLAFVRGVHRWPINLNFEIHWIKLYLVNFNGLAGIVNTALYKTANYNRSRARRIVVIFNTVAWGGIANWNTSSWNTMTGYDFMPADVMATQGASPARVFTYFPHNILFPAPEGLPVCVLTFT